MTVQRLKEIRKKILPDLIFLMETKNTSEIVLQSLQWSDYPSHFLVPPISPGAGGLALFWKQSLEVDIISSNQHFIDTKIKTKGRSFFATFLYGELEKQKDWKSGTFFRIKLQGANHG